MPLNPVFTPVDNFGNVIGQVASGDSLNPGTIPGFNPLIFNGTTFDRLRGSNGAVNTIQQAAFSLYTEAVQSRTTSGNLTGSLFLLNNAQQALVSVNLATLTGGSSPSITVSFQQQDANGNWVTCGSSAALTAVGTYVFSVGAGTNNANILVPGSGQWRLAWTVAGTPTALACQFGVTGR